MKLPIFLTLLLFSQYLFGQDKPQDILQGQLVGVNRSTTVDTVPIVSILSSNEKRAIDQALWYLDGAITDKLTIGTIPPHQISMLEVEKDTVVINGITYTGTIDVTTKDDYTPSLVSLNELKTKYLDLPNQQPTLFLLDGKVINKDYDVFKVDENYIMKIELQEVDNDKEELSFTMVKLLTRTAANMEALDEIRLKGGSF